jgi:hypothetical protein
MKRLSVLAVALAVCGAACSSNSTAPTNNTVTNVFTASLSPANEVPPVTNAESSVSGSVTVTVLSTKDASGNVTGATATFAVTLQGFPAGSSINIAHIHEGANTCACPVVVNTTLAAGEVSIGANGTATFTKSNINVDAAVAQRLISNAAGFYFNVHTTLNPGGVARGQLTRTS